MRGGVVRVMVGMYKREGFMKKWGVCLRKERVREMEMILVNEG